MIGVFDSGYGGLTILRALINRLPDYSYIYMGDNLHAPYGNLPDETIFSHTCSGVEWLFERGAELVILGCNTASAIALRNIQQNVLPAKYPDKRVLGIVVPTIEQITGAPWMPASPSSASGTVGVLGTRATIRSEVYTHEIHKRAPNIQVFQQACPSLVTAIEQNKDGDQIRKDVNKCVGSFLSIHGNVDAMLLGCTHYELIAPLIRSALPAETSLYEQPTIVAESTAVYLRHHPKIEHNLSKKGERMFYTTGNPEEISTHSSRYFGSTVRFEQHLIK